MQSIQTPMVLSLRQPWGQTEVTVAPGVPSTRTSKQQSVIGNGSSPWAYMLSDCGTPIRKLTLVHLAEIGKRLKNIYLPSKETESVT